MNNKIFYDENLARNFIEQLRWGGAPACARCGSLKVYRLTPKKESKSAVRKGVLKCGDCRQQFTVTVGTIFESSHIPLHKWLHATYLICCSKKGISSLQLQRMLGITYKSAWFLSHRIREAMKENNAFQKLKGIIEADETYVGGKARLGSKPGRGADRKTPVVVLVQREGKARSMPVKRVSSETLKGAIRENVHPKSTIMTDEWSAYKGIGTEFEGGHHTVNHSQNEYVRGDAYTNTAESYFALLKRGVNGTFHHVSSNHLNRYCNEFSFRWNTRKIDDFSRMKEAIKGAEGKRLMYKVVN